MEPRQQQHEMQEKEQLQRDDSVEVPHSGAQKAIRWLAANWRQLALILAPLLLLPVLVVNIDSAAGRCAYLLLLMAIFWVTECLPLCITSLLPICLGPLLCLSPASAIAPVYFSDTNMLFLGGLMFAVAVERCRLHARIASGILRLFGRQPRWLLLGMMLPAWLLSMIISNTAATAMLLPLTDAAGGDDEEEEEVVVKAVRNDSGGEGNSSEEDNEAAVKCRSARGCKSSSSQKLRSCLSLGVAYAANIGGTGTLIGTPPNLILAGVLSETFGTTQVNFLSWMLYGLPLSAISVAVTWVTLQTCVLGRRAACSCGSESEPTAQKQEQHREQKRENLAPEKQQQQPQLEQQQRMSFAEKMVLGVLVVLTLLWMTRSLGGLGWGRIFGKVGKRPMVSDSTPVLVAVLFLFALPSKPSLRAERLLTWEAVRTEFPWDIILLMGGSLALAKLTKTTGLSEILGQQLQMLGSLPSPLLVLLLPMVMVWATELLSNSAATSLTLPVLASLCSCIGVNPLLLMLPITAAASFAFCLPVATPPNAIAYCKGHVTIKQMARTGVLLNISLGLLTGAYTLLVASFGMFGMREVPDWAGNCTTTGA